MEEIVELLKPTESVEDLYVKPAGIDNFPLALAFVSGGLGVGRMACHTHSWMRHRG